MKAYNHQLTRQSHCTKNSFMPLICRASINDVKLSADFKDHSFSSFSGDPSSPKVTCIGQIKRNGKLIIPFSVTTLNYTLQSSTATATATTTTTTKSNGQVKYITLKKWFSAKNFTTNAPTSSTTTSAVHGGGGSCRSGGKETRSYVISTRRSSKINNDEGNSNNQPAGGGGVGHNVIKVNFKELDPPLPVVKKAQPPSEVNLWNRRSGGVALKSLLIKQR